jgi:tetratricopeptide (TPR) repeat protein
VTRQLLSLAISIVAAAAPGVARADDRPSKEQLAAAKQAFEEGNALYKAGKLAEAVEKLEESYRLSRNPFLLYNIGHIYSQLGQTDLVLSYFKKFLEDAPPDAKMRPEVQRRMQELEQERKAGTDTKPEDEVARVIAGELAHTQIFSAPAGVALDVSAVVSAQSPVKVTLFYRGTGDAKFTAAPMSMRDNEVVGQIPAQIMVGNWVQYYIEARGADNALIARSGKSTSPHLVKIEERARDLERESKVVVAEDDPIREFNLRLEREREASSARPFAVTKWIMTGVAASFAGGAIASYRIARNQHIGLVRDTQSCGTPPCREFDADFAQVVEDRGSRYSTIYKVTLGLGVASAAFAGYFWYRNLGPKRQPADNGAWVFTPAVDDGYAGVMAGARF